ncbi:hypothetical protein JTB14_029863 [Gonioctena quinquepunctata]|nr:hypothetical protein JTB14_029863 [Gonioctena quinquepunctata]
MPTANIVSGYRATVIYDEEKRGPNKDRIPLRAFKPDDLRRYQASLSPSQSLQGGAISTIASPQQDISNSQSTATVEVLLPRDSQIVSVECTTDKPSTSKSSEHSGKRSFGDFLLEMFGKDPSQPVEKKRKWLLTYFEIITTTEYLQKKEQEKKIYEMMKRIDLGAKKIIKRRKEETSNFKET